MSDNSSEFLKRTCLICGCHTNQTINIYEPRSGPNIVQLIQAKFKFQPLNEDKYLCFSCNNWLINWHSLQALNSNDAESPSGTFRSQLNSGSSVVQDQKSSGSKKQVAICRPIAQVKPRQLEQQRRQQEEPETTEIHKTLGRINFNKRHFRLQLAKRASSHKIMQKSMQQCLCGKYLVVRSTKHIKKSSRQTVLKCRKCREFARLKAYYLRSIEQVEKELVTRESPIALRNNQRNLVIQTEYENETVKKTEKAREADAEAETETETDTTRTSANKSQSINQQKQQQLHQQPQTIRQHYLPKPTIDGKVVSMLRRLGTTLSREPQENGSEEHIVTTASTNRNLPQIMSPTKSKTKWWRSLDEDEILVNFDSSISEVLPSLADQITHVNTIIARKRLAFQFTEATEVIDLCNTSDYDDDDEQNKRKEETHILKTNFKLPKGLSITLV